MKPVLFNPEMVRALLENRKTATRRVIKPKHGGVLEVHDDPGGIPCLSERLGNVCRGLKPPYRPGDILYVQETWYKNAVRYMYKADYAEDEKFYCAGKEVSIKWRPSIHMPKEAARIFLRVTSVRVERLQKSFFKPETTVALACAAEGLDIGEECRECIECYGNPPCIIENDGDDEATGECGILDDIRGDFSDLWDSTIKPQDRDRYGWVANPWVFVISFERITKNEAMQ